MTLASALAGKPVAFVNADVALDGEPVVGSFIVDSLTFAVTGESAVELVGVDPSVTLSGAAEGGEVEGSDEDHASEAGVANLALPESVAYENANYTLTAIAPYAFYLSGVTDVTLPASVSDVDGHAFRSSDVTNVTVADGNPSFSSYDGVLYDATRSSLLLIPGGRQGAVRISDKAEEVDASAFSHCAGVDSISVDAGSAHLSSWEGLLYDADGTTLLRVPAGATDITIREGCTTIAAGALEGCAQLSAITAPASIASVSPDVLTSVPTVSLPAASAVSDGPGASTQLSALVALSSTADDLPDVDPGAITVILPEGADIGLWHAIGFTVSEMPASLVAELGSATAYAASITIYGNGGTVSVWRGTGTGGNTVVAPGTNVDMASKVTQYAWPASSAQVWCNRIDMWTAGNAYYYSLTPDGRTGYTFTGWTGAATIPSTSTASQAVTSGAIYANWKANTYTVSFNANGGSGGQTANVTATYAANMPTISTTKPTRTGYTFGGWYDTSAATGGTQYYTAAGASARTWNKTANATLYARWTANKYAIAFDPQGGSAATSVQATYDANATLPTPTRQGYTFKGWDTKADGTGTRYQAGTIAKPNLTATANATVTLYAQWEPTISADVPFEVTARVDLLGIEEQVPASGYIESRCGEPLTVASIELTPLAGATEIFGAANVADVALEVLAAGSVSPDARFALDASASQAPASAAAFRMASYGTRVPIGYRFAIPDELLPTLVETEKPVCSVAYTVALA